MPNDHTNQIALERGMMQTYGVTRSQARESLHRAATTRALEAQVARQQAAAPSQVQQNRAEIKVTEDRTQKAVFIAPPGGASQPAPPASSGSSADSPTDNGTYVLNVVGGVATWKALTITPVTITGFCGEGDLVVSAVSVAT